MNMKSIITSALFMAGLVAMTSCSTETIWEEYSYGQEQPSYSHDDLPAMVTVYKDRAEVKLYKPVMHNVYLDGVLMQRIKPTGNDDRVVLRALTPNTEYHLYITALYGEQLLTKDVTFTTHMPYASVVGWVEMNYYDGEEELGFSYQMPGGDILDQTHRYYYYSDDDYCLRRTDAEGRVKWRSYIPYHYASVSDDGQIAAWTYDKVCRVDPETGAVMYEYASNLKNGNINSAYVCSDGGMVIVGKNHVDGKSYFHFTRLDASGQLIHEEEGDLADELYNVNETADGNLVAMGRKDDETFVVITFDAEGNVIGESSDYEERRDLGYLAYFKQTVRDNQGNIYFLGGAEVNTERGYAPAAVVIKVDAQGKIVWTRTMVNEYDEFYATCMHFVDDDRFCVLYSGKTTNVALLNTDNEILRDVSLNANYDVLYGRAGNEEYTQFYLLDKYGRIIYIDTKGE